MLSTAVVVTVKLMVDGEGFLSVACLLDKIHLPPAGSTTATLKRPFFMQIKLSMINWMNCVWESDLPPYSKYLAAYLRKFMNDNQDMAWPSYERIIHETGLSRQTVWRYFDVLDSEGWLIRDKGNSTKNTKYIASFPVSIEESMKAINSSLQEPRQFLTGTKVVPHGNTNKQYNKQYNKQRVDAIEYEKIKELYNRILGKQLTSIRALTDQRKKHIKARINEDDKRKDLLWWENYFYAVSESDFLTGNGPIREGSTKPWSADIDFLISQSGMVKVIEGKYHA